MKFSMKSIVTFGLISLFIASCNQNGHEKQKQARTETISATQVTQNTTVNNVDKVQEVIDKIDGKIIGKYKVQLMDPAVYVLYQKGKTILIKIIFPDGSSTNDEMLQKKVPNGLQLRFKENNFQGEYLVLNKDGELEFYNRKDEKFNTVKAE